MIVRSAGQWQRSPWFLVTPPEPTHRPESTVVVRRRLRSAIEFAVTGHPVTIIQAPSGYGKTTALADWVDSTEQLTAWLTLTSHDGSDDRVLAGLLSALQRAAGTADGQDLESMLSVVPDPDDLSATLARIGAAVEELPAGVTVVVDDAHLAPPDLAEQLIGVLAELARGRLRFVLAGTSSLDSWFTRHLARGDAVIIGPDRLGFTEQEVLDVAGLASADPGTPADPGAARRIHAATDGWPIAVRLALTAGHPIGSADLAGELPDEVLVEYVARQVIDRLPKDLGTFILEATTCVRLTAGLAEALTGRTDSAAMLEECVRQGLFLVRHVDSDYATVYRWHTAFARNCRVALARRDPARAAELNLAAARLLADRFPSQAVVHALRAGEPELAMRMLRESWVRLIIESGADSLATRCRELPEPWAGSAEILFIRACCLDVGGDRTGAMVLFDRASAVADPADAQTCLTRSFAELFLADDQEVLARACDRVRDALHSDETTGVHAYALFLLGWTEVRLRRNPAEVVRLLTSARREAESSGFVTLARRATTSLAWASAFGGHLVAAAAMLDRTDTSSVIEPDGEWEHYDGGLLPTTSGFIAYWQNDLVTAASQFRLAAEFGNSENGYSDLARAYFALTAANLGDVRVIAEARGLLRGMPTTDRRGIPWNTYRVLAMAELAAASGDHQRALSLLDSLTDVQHIPVATALMADLFRRMGRPESALRTLKQIDPATRVAHVAVSTLVTTAAIAGDRGQRQLSHRRLERALDIAVPERILRPFAGTDGALTDLLGEHASWGTAHEEFLATELVRPVVSGELSGLLGQQLSRREREVFGYLHTTMTAEEIGAALFLSVNTVRTHQRAIYRKLGVGSRREAIRYRV